jgi:hypothetical protein
MLQRVITVGHDLVAESLTFDETGNMVWAATTNGALVTARLLDQRITLIGSGYRRPIGVIPGHDGLTVAVVEHNGRTWLALREQASRLRAQFVTDLPGRVLAARRHLEPGRILVLTTLQVPAGGPDPTIFSVDLRDGTANIIASGLTGARAFVVDEARRELAVLAMTPSGERSLSVVGLDDGAVTPGPDVALAFNTILTSPDPAEHAVVGAYADEMSPGWLTLLRFDGTSGSTLDLARPVHSLTRWGSLVLAACGADLVAVEWGLDEGNLPIDTPLGPLYVNGYARLAVDLASAGLTPNDVGFAVREGPEAGSISAGIESPAADGTQPVVLVAGFRPGEYHVEARLRADASLLARRRFRVTACWPDEIIGPPVAVTGPRQSYHLMSWGGAGAAAGYLLQAPPLWRVAVVLVATKDRRWDALEGAAKNDWKERVIGGGDSVKHFYEEVSYKNTTIELAGGRVLGPVNLDEGWGDVFEPKKGGGLNDGWLSKQTGKEILANAISSWMADQPDGAQIMALADSIAIVVRSATDMPTTIGTAPPIPTQYAWGHAAAGTNFWRKTATTFTQGPKPIVVMTDVYPAALPVKPILEHTFCHEIGHNLGLDDLYDANNDYPAEINDRSPANADLMASSRPLPHFSIGNRLRLGWIKAAWLRRFDFSASPSGGVVTLHATERLIQSGPPPGRVAGIEVPIQDGWSYLFELRRAQGDQIGDQGLNSLSASRFMVLGTDLRVSRGESARPPILFLPVDVDGDGPVLDAANEDYKDSDTTNPERMHDFGLVVQAIGAPDADSAQVRVDYIAAHRPQLQIRPAPGRGNFKSPDIDLIGPFGVAVTGVVKGVTNGIRITVHNLGTLAATQVQIHVKWLPFTLSAGSWRTLPDPSPFNVPALGITSLVVPWDLPASVKVGDVEAEHFCVRVEIDRYRDPAHPAQEEIVVFDNWAQSNFDSASVSFGSPSQRIRTVGTATNPLGRAATYRFIADQSGDGYRVYVGHAWLRLPPGDTRPLELAYENLSDDPVYGAQFAQNLERISSRPNHVAVTSWLVPENTECDTPREWWGVALDLRAGRRAWIEDFRRDGELVIARVRASRNDTTIDVTHGDVYLAAWAAENPRRVSVTKGLIRLDGTARVLLSNETLHDIDAGSRIIATLARPADVEFARAISEPTLLN